MFHALLIVPDAIGDQVLRQPLYALMESAGWCVTLFARRGVFGILALVAPGAELVELPVDHDASAEKGNDEAFSRLLGEVNARKPDVLVAVLKNPTWIEAKLFENHTLCRRVTVSVFGPVDTRRKMELETRRRRLDAASDLLVSVPESSHDAEAPAAMAVALGLAKSADQVGRPALSRDALPDAGPILARHGLTAGDYAFSAPAGFTNVSIKALPQPMVCDFIRHLRARHGLPVLLAGVESEAAWLGEIATRSASPLWIGGPGSLPECLALLANARCYVGADTGTMHLAAALGTPVFAIFGAGAWGRFLPLARRRAVVTQWLPCAGCDWVCLYSEARCITGITEAAVVSSIDWLLEAPELEGDRIDTGEPQSPAATRCFKDLLVAFEHAEIDRAARLDVIHAREADIGALQSELGESRRALESDRMNMVSLEVSRSELSRKVADFEAMLNNQGDDERSSCISKERRGIFRRFYTVVFARGKSPGNHDGD